jgi:hypothetical protein
MLYSFRKLYNDYLTSVETKDFDQCFQDHTKILLQNKKDLYAAQRTILSLRHRMFMGFELTPFNISNADFYGIKNNKKVIANFTPYYTYLLIGCCE